MMAVDSNNFSVRKCCQFTWWRFTGGFFLFPPYFVETASTKMTDLIHVSLMIVSAVLTDESDGAHVRGLGRRCLTQTVFSMKLLVD